MVLYISSFLVGKKGKILSDPCPSQEVPVMFDNGSDLVANGAESGNTYRSFQPPRFVTFGQEHLPGIEPGPFQRSTDQTLWVAPSQEFTF